MHVAYLLLALLLYPRGCESRAYSEAQAKQYHYMELAMASLGRGYTWRAYEAVTTDGYILTLFRIIADKHGDKIEGQGRHGPLLMQHGFTTDSISWFDVSDVSRAALPVQLFEEGFDVWLGNNRGTRHSRKHQWLDADIH